MGIAVAKFALGILAVKVEGSILPLEDAVGLDESAHFLSFLFLLEKVLEHIAHHL